MEVSSMCSANPQGQTTQKEEIMRILTWNIRGRPLKRTSSIWSTRLARAKPWCGFGHLLDCRGKSGGMQIGINTSLLGVEESLVIVYGPCSA